MIHWTAGQLYAFVQLLHGESYEVLGPVIRDAAVTYDVMERLPVGYGDEQEAGHYRLTRRQDQTRFGYNLGPSTWKQFLFTPTETLFSVAQGLIHPQVPAPKKRAFIGVRACELGAGQVIGVNPQADRRIVGQVIQPGKTDFCERNVVA